MSALDLQTHLATGATTVCRVWTIERRDGLVQGFTDHDRDLLVEDVLHRAASGLTPRVLQQGSGLAVDNSEVLGALVGDAISEVDLVAGRYDGAKVRLRLVNWAETTARQEIFRGTIGEVTRSGGEFRAELRGIAEALGQPVGQAYTRTCAAVLGDGRCRFDLSTPGYFVETAVSELDEERRTLFFHAFTGFDDRWFEGGRIEVVSGAAIGLTGMVKSDRQAGADRHVELWQGIRAGLAAGDLVKITAGCDKRPETCRLKFGNLLNFRGFPFIPGEDWLSAYPRPGQGLAGGSLTTG